MEPVPKTRCRGSLDCCSPHSPVLAELQPAACFLHSPSFAQQAVERGGSIFLLSLLPRCLGKLRHCPLFSPCANCLASGRQGGSPGSSPLHSQPQRVESAWGGKVGWVGLSALPCKVQTWGTCSPAMCQAGGRNRWGGRGAAPTGEDAVVDACDEVQALMF